MERIWTSELREKIGQDVLLKGWVDVRRDHGKLVFLDLRDRGGKVQMLVMPQSAEAYAAVQPVRPEWVIEVVGTVNQRPANMVKEGEQNGSLEIFIKELRVLNEALTPPFDVTSGGLELNEEARLEFRYLDLRRSRMLRNMLMRDKIITFFREYMHRNNFIEIETPILMKGTPEGSREYVVPSRLETGKFYALPQSPQQFKQLCMVAGIERYFQIARCFRDEDLRGDRQPEFTQLDFEMSFTNQEEILKYTEAMFIELVEKLFSDKAFTSRPFARLTYAEAMEKYGSDKPDLRVDKNNQNELAFCWITYFLMFEKNDEGDLTAAHHPFCSVKEEDLEKFMKGEDLMSIRANSYDLVLNGYELSSGSIRIHKRAEQKQVFDLLEISEAEQEARFGHILRAFQYGAPPHGGFAPGIDRICMLLLGEANIREVIAFPKNGEAKDLMMGAPDLVNEKQLKELGLEVKKKAAKK
mgnify:FL=1